MSIEIEIIFDIHYKLISFREKLSERFSWLLFYLHLFFNVLTKIL